MVGGISAAEQVRGETRLDYRQGRMQACQY